MPDADEPAPAVDSAGHAPADPADPVSSTVPADAAVPRTPASAAAYQRQRLWIGIGGIGSILLLQWAGVVGCFPAWVNQTASESTWFGGSLGGVVTASLLAAAAVLVQLPFDVLGRQAEARFDQWCPGGPGHPRPAGAAVGGGGRQSWWRRWWSSAWRWVAAAAMGGAALGLAWEADPSRWLAWSILALALLSSVAVTLPVRPGERVVPDAAEAWESRTRQHIVNLGLAWPRIRWYDHGERSLAGGWHGLGPWSQLWLSTSLLDVPPAIGAGLIVRELGHADRGDRAFGVLGSAAWIAAGLAAAWILAGELLAGEPAVPAGLVVVVALVMSTWSWLGLFVWPALGRRQVLAADRFMLRAGMTREDAVAVLDELSDRNRPDESLPAAVAFVFHPIPPMEVRRRVLRGDDEPLRVAADADRDQPNEGNA